MPRVIEVTVVVILSVTIAGCVLYYKWMGLLVGLAGIGFLAFLFTAPLKALLLWLVASPILDFYLRISLGAGVPDITFTRATVVSLFLVILLQIVLNMRGLMPRQQTENFLLIFFGLAIFSMMMRGGLIRNLQVFLDGYATPFALFFLSKNLIREEEDFRSFLFALYIVGFYLAAIGIVQYFTDFNLFAPDTLIVTHSSRAYGPFGNSVEYGGVMAILFFAVLYFYTEYAKSKKVFIFANLVLIGVATFLSLTRAVWLSLIIGLFIIAYYLPRYRKIMAFFSVSAVVSVISAWMLLPATGALKERAGDIGAIFSRIPLYATALKTAMKKPLLGYGFGANTFFNASRDNLVSISFIPEHLGLSLSVPHNEFLHILVMLGLVGLAAYIGIFYSSFKKSLRLYKSSSPDLIDKKKIAVFFQAILAVFIINGSFADLIWFSYFNSLLLLIMGVMESEYMQPKQKKESI
jgi:O-antigen ligase